MDHSLVKIQADILLLLLIASLGAVFFKRLKLPFTVGLVIVGLGLGLLEPWLMPFQSLVVSHDLIIFLFVPPLVFASASNLNSRLFFRNLTPILILAVPGLVLSMLLIGVWLAWLTPLRGLDFGHRPGGRRGSLRKIGGAGPVEDAGGWGEHA
jgi:CPA1 family monovalent cation:H+ antiporter